MYFLTSIAFLVPDRRRMSQSFSCASAGAWGIKFETTDGGAFESRAIRRYDRAMSSHFWSLWWTILIQRHSTTASRVLLSRPVIPASSLTWPSTRTCYFALLRCRMLLLPSWTIGFLVSFSVLNSHIWTPSTLLLMLRTLDALWLSGVHFIVSVSLSGVLWNRDIVKKDIRSQF